MHSWEPEHLDGPKVGLQVNAGYACLSDSVASLTFKLKKVGSPTGNASCRIWNSADVVQTTLGQIDVSTLTTDFVAHTFNTGPAYTCSAGDIMGMEYDAGSSTTNVTIETDNSSGTTNACRGQYTPTWEFNCSRSLYYIQAGVASTTLLPPPPAYVRI